jgi:hypothetical protein
MYEELTIEKNGTPICPPTEVTYNQSQSLFPNPTMGAYDEPVESCHQEES